MKDCKKFENLFEKLISGNISDTEYKVLLDHVEVCADCRSLYETHDVLGLAEWPQYKADEQEFRNMRIRVMNQIPETSKKKFKVKKPSWLQVLFQKPAYVPAFSLIMLIAGFFTGRIYFAGTASNGDQLIRHINYVAQQNDAFSDVQNSPYIFTNVKIKSQNDNKVNLSFDVTTHVDTERPKNDPLVKEVLAQSLLNPSSLGTRLKAIRVAGKEFNPKIKEALLFSLQNDPSIAVRLKAMSALMNIKKDNEISNAFIDLLDTEESVQMRLMAIEYLAQSDLNKDALQRAMKGSNEPADTPIKLKMNEFLK